MSIVQQKQKATHVNGGAWIECDKYIEYSVDNLFSSFESIPTSVKSNEEGWHGQATFPLISLGILIRGCFGCVAEIKLPRYYHHHYTITRTRVLRRWVHMQIGGSLQINHIERAMIVAKNRKRERE